MSISLRQALFLSMVGAALCQLPSIFLVGYDHDVLHAQVRGFMPMALAASSAMAYAVLFPEEWGRFAARTAAGTFLGQLAGHFLQWPPDDIDGVTVIVIPVYSFITGLLACLLAFAGSRLARLGWTWRDASVLIAAVSFCFGPVHFISPAFRAVWEQHRAHNRVIGLRNALWQTLSDAPDFLKSCNGSLLAKSSNQPYGFENWAQITRAYVQHHGYEFRRYCTDSYLIDARPLNPELGLRHFCLERGSELGCGFDEARTKCIPCAKKSDAAR